MARAGALSARVRVMRDVLRALERQPDAETSPNRTSARARALQPANPAARRQPAKPRPAKPVSSIAQVEGSGTATRVIGPTGGLVAPGIEISTNTSKKLLILNKPPSAVMVVFPSEVPSGVYKTGCLIQWIAWRQHQRAGQRQSGDVGGNGPKFAVVCPTWSTVSSIVPCRARPTRFGVSGAGGGSVSVAP